MLSFNFSTCLNIIIIVIVIIITIIITIVFLLFKEKKGKSNIQTHLKIYEYSKYRVITQKTQILPRFRKAPLGRGKMEKVS